MTEAQQLKLYKALYASACEQRDTLMQAIDEAIPENPPIVGNIGDLMLPDPAAYGLKTEPLTKERVEQIMARRAEKASSWGESKPLTFDQLVNASSEATTRVPIHGYLVEKLRWIEDNLPDLLHCKQIVLDKMRSGGISNEEWEAKCAMPQKKAPSEQDPYRALHLAIVNVVPMQCCTVEMALEWVVKNLTALLASRKEWMMRALESESLYSGKGEIVIPVSAAQIQALQKDKARMDWQDADCAARYALPAGKTLRQHVDERMSPDREEEGGLEDE